ncbi:hypothetical protein [Nonomuraea sp. SYSU D8015]|uniref:hypothetical protein n=1 Tax=Nonomuraea sp. SYSU D8015 TaxID=2593644 RepID=UPI001660A2BF|nr:hypothetical protein [Nonomuraea sp. SYSU D8015]
MNTTPEITTDDLGDVWRHPGLTDDEQFPGADHDFALINHEGTWVSYCAAPAGFFTATHPSEAAAREAFTTDVTEFLLGGREPYSNEFSWKMDMGEGTVDEIAVVPVADRFDKLTWYVAWRLNGECGYSRQHDREDATEAAFERARQHAADIEDRPLGKVYGTHLLHAIAAHQEQAVLIEHGDAIREAYEYELIGRGRETDVKAIADRLGVSRSHFYNIVNREAWTWDKE